MNKFTNYYCQHSIPATSCSICSYTRVQTNVSLINVGEINEPIGNTEQLPVAWFHEDDFSKGVSLHKDNFVNAIPLYAHPPIRELTEAEILEVWKENYGDVNISNFARAILKKASEK